jgi:anti-anti-sigma regulatory factor
MRRTAFPVGQIFSYHGGSSGITTKVTLLILHKILEWYVSCSIYDNPLDNNLLGGKMPSIHIDNVGDMAIIECAGRFVRTEGAFKLRDAVTSQTDARVVVLDLTEMHAIGGGGLGMLVLLQRWAQDRDIGFKLFNPSRPVREKLKHVNFEIATLEQMMTLLSHVDSEYARALIESQFPLHQMSQYS